MSQLGKQRLVETNDSLGSEQMEKNKREIGRLIIALNEQDWSIHIEYDNADGLVNSYDALQTLTDKLSQPRSRLSLDHPYLAFTNVSSATAEMWTQKKLPHSFGPKFFPGAEKFTGTLLDSLTKETGNDLTGVFQSILDNGVEPFTATKYGAILAKALYHKNMIDHEIAFALVGTTLYICLRGSKVRKDYFLDAKILYGGYEEAQQRASGYTGECKAKLAQYQGRFIKVEIVGHSLGGLLACFVAQNLSSALGRQSKAIHIYNPYFGIATPGLVNDPSSNGGSALAEQAVVFDHADEEDGDDDFVVVGIKDHTGP